MSYLSRFFGLNFVFLLLASLFVLTVTPVSVGGQGVSKPSVPQFSVKVVGNYYYVPPSTTTSVDEYTGKETTITRPGYYRDERVLVVSVKNQSFKSIDASGRQYSLYYNVQSKGHFGDEWRTFFHTTFQSDSDYTIFTTPYIGVYEAGDQLDFRVEAKIGHRDFDISTYHENISWVYNVDNYVIFGLFLDVASSGWSDVLTFTMPDPVETTTLPPTNTLPTSSSDSLTPDSNTPSVSDPLLQISWPTFLLIIIVIMCFITIPLVIFAYHYGQRKNKFLNGDSVKKVVCEVKNFECPTKAG